MKITVVGSGGWGTALALLLLENGNDVTLWSHRESTCETLRTTHENPLLKGVALPDALKHTSEGLSDGGNGHAVLRGALYCGPDQRSGGPRYGAGFCV